MEAYLRKLPSDHPMIATRISGKGDTVSPLLPLLLLLLLFPTIAFFVGAPIILHLGMCPLGHVPVCHAHATSQRSCKNSHAL